jgi:hypothetical protein
MLLFVMLGVYYRLASNPQSQAAALECEVAVLQRALAATGAKPGEAEFHGWTKVSDRYMPPRELEELVREMARAFELTEAELDIILRATGFYAYAVVDFKLTESISLRIQAQALQNQTIASVEFRQGHQRDMAYNLERVREALKLVSGNGDINITSCLVGTINGRVKNSEKLNIAAAAFVAVRGSYLEGIELNTLSVWTGWSPFLPEGIEFARQQINFSVSVGSDSAGKTIIRVATPVIPGSYR